MIRAIVPQFFTADMTRTLGWFRDMLGFDTQFQYGDPVTYAGAIRNEQSVFFRLVDAPLPVPTEKYSAELLDAYFFPTDVHALYAEYTGREVVLHRPLAEMPWGFVEFVVCDIDGRLLCFGQSIEVEEV